MKAVAITEYGSVDKLELRELPAPKLETGALRVRVRAASINPIDWKIRSGAAKARFPVEFPWIPGRDVAGEVLEVGAGVTGFAPGDRVMGLVNHGYAGEVVAAAEAFAKIPGGLDFDRAASLPLVGLTGSQLVTDCAKPGEGQVVLVTGAVGGVGRSAVFTAKALGAKVVAGVRAKQKDAAAKLGAWKVVALDVAGELDGLPALDALADTVGGEPTQKLLGKLKPGGVIGSVVGEPAGAKERGLTVRAMMAHPDAKRLAELGEALASGALEIPIAKTFPLAEVREAQALAERGGAGGKVLLIP